MNALRVTLKRALIAALFAGFAATASAAAPAECPGTVSPSQTMRCGMGGCAWMLNPAFDGNYSVQVYNGKVYMMCEYTGTMQECSSSGNCYTHPGTTQVWFY